MVFALNGTVTLTFDLVTLKFIGVIYWPWPIFLPSTMTVTHKLFKILSGHDVANGRTDRQTDGQTDGRTPYHNTSEVLLWAYKKRLVLKICIINLQRKRFFMWFVYLPATKSCDPSPYKGLCYNVIILFTRRGLSNKSYLVSLLTEGLTRSLATLWSLWSSWSRTKDMTGNERTSLLKHNLCNLLWSLPKNTYDWFFLQRIKT